MLKIWSCFNDSEKCSHLGGPLSEGKIEGTNIQCPWHGSQFDLATGAVHHGPATFKQPCYETRLHDGKIQVRKLNAAATNGKPSKTR